jgi:hypothetical protein
MILPLSNTALLNLRKPSSSCALSLCRPTHRSEKDLSGKIVLGNTVKILFFKNLILFLFLKIIFLYFHIVLTW